LTWSLQCIMNEITRLYYTRTMSSTTLLGPLRAGNMTLFYFTTRLTLLHTHHIINRQGLVPKVHNGRQCSQCVAVCVAVMWGICMCMCAIRTTLLTDKICSVLQCVAVCCSVLQCVAVCCSVLQCVVVCELWGICMCMCITRTTLLTDKTWSPMCIMADSATAEPATYIFRKSQPSSHIAQSMEW